MGKIGFNKGKADAKVVPQKTTNRAGGIAYTITDPAERLIAAVGSYMGEPGYYPDKAGETQGPNYNTGVLDEKGRAILDTAIELVQENRTEDLLRIAYFTRDQMHMRLVPQILLVAAARFHDSSKDDLVSVLTRYVQKICTRADDILQAYALYMHLFGKRSNNGQYMRARLPKPFQKGLGMAIRAQSDMQIIKYNQEGMHPNFGDVLRTLRHVKAPKGISNEGFPVSKGMHKYLLTGEIAEDSPEILRARKQFFKLNKETTPLGEGLMELAKEAGLTWEDFVSHFGGTKDSSRLNQVWGLATSRMGYMATLRNLRNVAQKGTVNTIKRMADKLADKDGVLKSKQLPFRFYSAYKAVESTGINRTDKQYVIDKLYEALDHSVENMPSFPGASALFIDCSGSMSSQVSAQSTVSHREAATVTAALFYKKCPGSVMYTFSDKAYEVPSVTQRDPVLTTVQKTIAHRQGDGWSTHFHECLKELTRKKIKVERIIVFSDMNTYGNGGSLGNVDHYLKEYRKKVNKDVFFHCINTSGQSVSMTPVSSDPRACQIAGWSDKLVKLIQNHEAKALGQVANDSVSEAGVQMPTLDEIRKTHTVALPKVYVTT